MISVTNMEMELNGVKFVPQSGVDHYVLLFPLLRKMIPWVMSMQAFVIVLTTAADAGIMTRSSCKLGSFEGVKWRGRQ